MTFDGATSVTVQNNKTVKSSKIKANSVFGTEMKAYFDTLGLDYTWVVSYSISSCKGATAAFEALGDYGIKPALHAPKGGVLEGFTQESGSFGEKDSLAAYGNNDEIYTAFKGFQGSGTVSNVKATFTYADKANPTEMYVSPIALTEYKAGEKVMLTVIYSEPINSISGTPTLSLSSKLKSYFKNPTYVNNGSGTNALVFEVTVKDGVTIDATTAQKINEYLAFPENNNASSGFSGNIGTVSATVKDIKGN